MKLDKDYTKIPLWFLVKDATLVSDNPLRFKKNLLINDCLWENQTIDNKIEEKKAWYNLDK